MNRLLPLLAAALLACGGPTDEEAAAAVRRYDDALVLAYRTGDAELVEPVAGPAEARKVQALIGAKLDMGLTLDSELLELQVLGVTRAQEAAEVRTVERWRYADRRVGTGVQVGDASVDRYALSYRLVRAGRSWVVDSVTFTEPPQVGRKSAPVGAPARSFHALADGASP